MGRDKRPRAQFCVQGLAGQIPVRFRSGPSWQTFAAWGAYSPTDRQIHVDSSMGRPMEDRVLWHEWVHSVLDDAHIRLGRSKEEAICAALASALMNAGVTLPRTKR